MKDHQHKLHLPAWAILLDVFGTLLFAAGIYALIGGEDLLFAEFLELRPFAVPLIITGVLLMLPLVMNILAQAKSRK